MILCDRFIQATVIGLLLATPLAFGTVHPWAYSLMEALVAVLVLAWAVKLWRGRKRPASVSTRIWPFALPLILFAAFVVFQLAPLPPSVLQKISPATYEVYERALPGWPERPPYAELRGANGDERRETGVGAAIDPSPVSGSPSLVPPESRRPMAEGRAPLPLSLAPALTQTDLLKFGTYALLFLLVLLYTAPGAGRDPRPRVERELDFVRPFLYVILFSGFAVATLGFLNLFTWNGKVLWVFVPHDANGGGGGVRAAAPFIAPPSFANYLAVVLPLAVIGALRRSFLTPARFGAGFRVLCAFAAFMMFCGILLSLSRAGWASAMLGVGVAVLLLAVVGGRERWFARTPVRRLLVFGSAGFCLLLLVALLFVGPQGQENLDWRLEQSLTQDATSLHGRFAIWEGSLRMVRDFPLLGVGLGAWPDLFPRYQDPGLAGFYREGHNDYLELLAETGVAGSLLLLWFFVVCVTRIAKHVFSLDAKVVPVVAALCGGICAMAFHEIFDFNLQIPANALLFTVVLALAVRLLGSKSEVRSQRSEVRFPASDLRSPASDLSPRTSELRPRTALAPFALATVALLLLSSAFSQPMSTYPYYLRSQVPLADALAAVLNHPANADAHAALFDAAYETNDFDWQLDELERILWLAPGRTVVRDAYAGRLLLDGRGEQARYEITRSVAQAPSVDAHSYLSRTAAPALSPEDQDAVIFGFRKAIEGGHPSALAALAEFYRRTERFSDLAGLYEEAAGAVHDPRDREDYLARAADAAIEAGELERAKKLLLEAAGREPDNTTLLTRLIAGIYEPQGDLAAVEQTVDAGIQNGADALALQLSLAEAAQSVGDEEVVRRAMRSALESDPNGGKTSADRYQAYVRLARIAHRSGQDQMEAEALEKAIELQPGSYSALMEVARMHAARNDLNRAAFYYRKAARQGRNADALAALASIEERRFRYPEADQAYAEAVRLAPENESLRKRYQAFQERVAAAKNDGRRSEVGDQRSEVGGRR